ncbi:hypothetical protein SRABI06_04257 [Pseudomonas brassicacearum]|nr:hypothetical protein SRABI06_04257 [Pseudomonas brassicacearum]
MTAAPEILGHLWRGSLLPLGCAAAPFVSAAHSSGSKLPRHNSLLIEAWSGC